MESKTPIFKSRGNGKLLLSGEYLILKGSKGLSLPVKYGQDLEVFENETNNIIWKSYKTDGLWHSVTLDQNLSVIETSDADFANRLQVILKQCLIQSAKTIEDIISKTYITHIDFDPDWGLGTSSTLLFNLSIFFNIDAYQLQLKTFNGSGYDVANAGINNAIFYYLEGATPNITSIPFNPTFKNSLYFIYSGKKVSSKSAIARFSHTSINQQTITSVSQISDLLLSTINLDDFIKLLKLHESIIGELIEQEPIQSLYFDDFQGGIKSLGAWGGDFFLAATNEPQQSVESYFKNKGYTTIFTYDQLILNNA